MVTTREASVEDAPQIAEVHVTSWRAAYRGLLPQQHLDDLDVVRRTEVWSRLLIDQGSRSRTFVAESSDGIVGFVSASETRDKDVDPLVTGEIPAIYLHPDVWGTGAGRLLLGLARAWLVEAGLRSATVWVLEGNSRARAFYEADGWRTDGAVKHDESRGFPVIEVRYMRALP